MGSKTTKLFRNSTQPDSKTQDNNESPCDEHFNFNDQQHNETIIKNFKSPFVHYRRG